MVNLCFDLVNTLKASAQFVTTKVGNPGVMLRWKYNLASPIRRSFGMGYFKMNQLHAELLSQQQDARGSCYALSYHGIPLPKTDIEVLCLNTLSQAQDEEIQ